jgi:hypothetical protein
MRLSDEKFSGNRQLIMHNKARTKILVLMPFIKRPNEEKWMQIEMDQDCSRSNLETA